MAQDHANNLFGPIHDDGNGMEAFQAEAETEEIRIAVSKRLPPKKYQHSINVARYAWLPCFCRRRGEGSFNGRILLSCRR